MKQLLISILLGFLATSCTQIWDEEQKTSYMRQCIDGFSHSFSHGSGHSPDSSVVKEWCACHLEKTQSEFGFEEIMEDNATAEVRTKLDRFRDDCFHDLNVMARLGD